MLWQVGLSSALERGCDKFGTALGRDETRMVQGGVNSGTAVIHDKDGWDREQKVRNHTCILRLYAQELCVTCSLR